MTLCSLTERKRNMNLIDLRREMDETDRALLALFARRMALSPLYSLPLKVKNFSPPSMPIHPFRRCRYYGIGKLSFPG